MRVIFDKFNPSSRENFRRGITPNIRMRKDAMVNGGGAANGGGVEAGSNGGAAEPFLKQSKEDEEEMEKDQKRKGVSSVIDRPMSSACFGFITSASP